MAFSRNRDPVQKLVGAAIAFYMTAFCVWAVCYAVLGTEALGYGTYQGQFKVLAGQF
jgi:hypothetical protein